MNQDIIDIALNKTYSITPRHAMKVSEMAGWEDKPQGEIIRIAIDALYEKLSAVHQPDETSETVQSDEADA